MSPLLLLRVVGLLHRATRVMFYVYTPNTAYLLLLLRRLAPLFGPYLCHSPNTVLISIHIQRCGKKWSRMLIGSQRLWHLLPYWLSPAIDVFPLMKQELMSGLRNGPLSPCLFFFHCNIFKGCSRPSVYSFPVFQKRLAHLWTGPRMTWVVCANELDSSGHWNKFLNLASDRGGGGKKGNWNLILFCQCIILRQGKKKKLLNENMPRNIRMMVLVLLKIAQGSCGRAFFVFLARFLVSCVLCGQRFGVFFRL